MYDVPKALALAADHATSVRHADHEHELLVLAVECAEEADQFLFSGVSIVLRSDQADQAVEFHSSISS